MRTYAKLAALMLTLALVSGCALVYEYAPELEPVKTYSDFALTDSGFWEFVDYCQRQWTWEKDLEGELCQDPFVSQQRLRGDCDDFACMIAYFAQEYWPYDSRTYRVRIYGEGYHRVAAVRTSYDTIEWYYSSHGCYTNRMYFYRNTSPTPTYYLPLDQSHCLWYGTHNCDVICADEWYEIVGQPLSVEMPSGANCLVSGEGIGECR